MLESERTIFLDALDVTPGEARQSFLDDACGDNTALRQSVEALLEAHDEPDHAVDRSPLIEIKDRASSTSEKTQVASLDDEVECDAVNDSNGAAGDDSLGDEIDDVGRLIDGYRLMECIGEGGFGLVYVAQQTQPVRRNVALKILRPGMASKEVLARFEAERQAVAMMDHPNIAQIFDAGVTQPDARPYFVMELVKGLAITKYASRRQLDLRTRLELVADVCDAIHHAHRKGIIHRDLKPSNLLVSEHGSRHVVKVIDFGVAKALESNLTEATIYTRFFSMIGTPLYMSPEQTALSGLDVDVRSDVYSLGVLLYELLTGTTPLSRDAIDSAGFDELRRMIREDDPPRPSLRLTTVRDQQPTVVDAPMQEIALERPLENIPGDLDWIVMKAIEKDRERRYDSASELAADLRRFLAGQPVEARPPTRTYRLSKFVRRNRAILATSGLLVASLAAGLAATTYQAMEATWQRDQKDKALLEAVAAKQQVEQFADNLKQVNSLASQAQLLRDAEQFAEAEALYTQAIDLVPDYFLVRLQRAQLRSRQYRWAEAAEDFAAAIELDAPYSPMLFEGSTAVLALAGQDQAAEMLNKRLRQVFDVSPERFYWSEIRTSLVVETDAQRLKQISTLATANLPRQRSLGEHLGQWLSMGPGPFHDRSGGPGPHEAVPRDHDERKLHDGGPPGKQRIDWQSDPHNPRPEPGASRHHKAGMRGPGGKDRLPKSVENTLVAWALARAGEPQESLKHCRQATLDRNAPGQVYPIAAISHFQLGNDADAREQLALADEFAQRLENASSASADAEIQEMQRPIVRWFDRAEFELLYSQARELIGQKTK